ncbi:P-loop containing nucleoside triphosphate hydrolase protein [Artomyces pyxidatus]|uniref:P-loop containing nucleoside triphosphate hydrolase protein n=1 Tax=Artomyces pyxidatus TaxID=48021 RepID=A0ACB8TIK6_9AGAM|nr:P-loop containing nucleoside triphosphate hydrolase protein [Artomyces pyxidatus]
MLCSRRGVPLRYFTPPPLSSPAKGTSRRSSRIALRPYQEACLDACFDALTSGVTRIGVSLPTGSGKTAVFTTLLSRLSPPQGQLHATRSLVIVNSIELARQAAAQAERLRPDWRVEIEQGAKHKASGLADVTVATYQTLLQAQRLEKFSPKNLKAIIIDEAHHAAAPSYRHILSHFDTAIQNPYTVSGAPGADPPHKVPIFGFSATFSRHDGLALGSVFERIVYHRDFLEMIKEQWLCNVRFTTVRANINLKEVVVNSRTGDFNPTSLAQVINTETVNKLVVQSWLEKAGERKSTLVFGVNVAHVRELTNAFRMAGIDARYVYAGTPMAERRGLIESFKAEEYPVLINCAILTEGADIPNIDCVVVARPTRSRNIFAQMIGRGMRLSPNTGKKDCRIIDFVDIINRVPGVVCTPTLFGLDPAEVVDDESTDTLEERAAATVEAETNGYEPDTHDNIPDPSSVTFVDHEDPFSLVNQASGASPHIIQLSRNAWVGCGDDIYVLECLGKGHIRIEPAEDEDTGENYVRAYFSPTLHFATAAAMGIPRFQTKRKILDALNLADAVRGSDTYAADKVLKGGLAMGLYRTAKWRKQPATPAQKAFVAKRWGLRPQYISGADSAEKVFPEKIDFLTKGEAANVITRLKHGAQARFAKKVKANLKVEKSVAKEKLRQAKEHVRVGPLPAPLIHPNTRGTLTDVS